MCYISIIHHHYSILKEKENKIRKVSIKSEYVHSKWNNNISNINAVPNLEKMFGIV